MGENRTRWDRALDALETLYRDVERRSLSLPMFSPRPFVICLWNFIKFIVCLTIDLYLAGGVTVRSLEATGSTRLPGVGEERRPSSRSL
jgi:hypothetical protein